MVSSKHSIIQGHIQKTENYKKGKKEGWWEEYYPDQTAKNRKTLQKRRVDRRASLRRARS